MANYMQRQPSLKPYVNASKYPYHLRNQVEQFQYSTEHTQTEYSPVMGDEPSHATPESDHESFWEEDNSLPSDHHSKRDQAWQNIFDYPGRLKTIEKHQGGPIDSEPFTKNPKKQRKLDNQFRKIIKPEKIHENVPMFNRDTAKIFKKYLRDNLGKNNDLESSDPTPSSDVRSSTKFVSKYDYEVRYEKKRAGHGFLPKMRDAGAEYFAYVPYHYNLKNPLRYEHDRQMIEARVSIKAPTQILSRKDFLKKDFVESPDFPLAKYEIYNSQQQGLNLIGHFLKNVQMGETAFRHRPAVSTTDITSFSNNSKNFRYSSQSDRIYKVLKMLPTPIMLTEQETEHSKESPKISSKISSKMSSEASLKISSKASSKISSKMSSETSSKISSVEEEEVPPKAPQQKPQNEISSQIQSERSSQSETKKSLHSLSRSSQSRSARFPLLKKKLGIKKLSTTSKTISSTKSTKPISSTKSTKPISSTKSTKPISSTKSTKPISSTKSTKPISSTKSTKPISSTKSTKPISSTKSTKPISSTISSRSTKSASHPLHSTIQALMEIRRKKEIEEKGRISERLSKMGLYEIKVRGDGNCQFRALALFLMGSEEHHFSMRQKLVQWLRENEKDMQEFAAATQFSTWSLYCNAMSRDFEWGDHFTLVAAATLYNIRICVVSTLPLTKGASPIHFVDPSNNSKPSEIIHLLHYHENHFNALKPSGSKVNYDFFDTDE